MNTTKKPAFPQTPDGVTDWEQVFEGPNGLIALISQVRTAAALRECTLVVIGQLFTRKQDQLEVAQLTRQLDNLIAGSDASQDISTTSMTVAGLLRQIKDERIQKAQDYLADKQKKGGKNRRSGSFGGSMSSTTYRLINDPKFSLIVGGAALILLIGILGIIININTDGKLTAALGFGAQEKSDPQVELANQPELPTDAKPQDPTQPEQPARTEKSTTPEEPKPEPDPTKLPASKKPVVKDTGPVMPPALVMTRIFLPRLSGTSQKASRQVLPILVLAEPSDLSNLCEIRPVILDALNSQFGKLLGRKSKLTDTDLDKVSFEVMNRLNARLRRTAVVKMVLVQGANYQDRASLLCSLASGNFLKYITDPE